MKEARQLLKDLATLSQQARLEDDTQLAELVMRANRGDPAALIDLRPALIRVRETREKSVVSSRPKVVRGRLASPFSVGDRVVLKHRVFPFLIDEILTVSQVENIGSKSKPTWLVRCESHRGMSGRTEATSLQLASHALAERVREASSLADFERSLTAEEAEEVVALAGSKRGFWEASRLPLSSSSPPVAQIERDVALISGAARRSDR